LRSLENKWALAAIIYLLLGGLLFSANILAGWRQSVEGNGTWARLLGVAAYAATAQLLPLLALSAMTVNSKVGTDSIRQTGTAIIAFLYSAFWVTLSLRPTVRPIAGKDPLPLVNQPGFVERVEEIASQLRIRTPVVRQLDSGGGAMSIAAFAGGLPAPSIVVSDGVLFRLKDLERDAIVAHELGHIANRSLWAYPVVPTIAAVAAVLTSVRLPLLSAVLLGMSVQIALFRVVSRYFEFSSDRHAARAIGVAETITALDKTHVASPIGNKGWWSFLAYATATHPSLEERLSALKQLHSEDGELPISWSESAAQRRRRGARIAGLLWLATVVILVALPQTDATELATIPILLATVFGPYLLIQKAIRKDVRTEMKRRQNASQARSSNWGVLIVLVLSVLLLFYMDHSLAEFKATLVTMAALGLVIFFAIVLLGTVLSRRNPYIKMLQAQQRRDWNEAIRIGEANLKKWKGDPAPRTDLALIKWMAGRRDEAIADLAELRESFPKFKQSWLTAAILELSRGNYHVATKLALEAAEDLPDDMAPHVIAARCQRLLGDVDKLREQSEIVTKIDPGSSSAPALEMLVAMLEGHGSVAWQKLEETEKQAPGDPFVLLLRAEMEHRFGDEQKAREALSSAQRILAASPMSFLQPELEHVRKLIDPPAETLPSLNGPEPPSIH
ncbi:MAG: M48 family metalloprotease, partial [Planctomycetaceae bacterium]|nr:M48 family metalloprotease [Planctomycetaceae bacterium]